MLMLDMVVSLGWGALSLTCEKVEKMFHTIAAKGKASGVNSKKVIRSLSERGAREKAAFKENISNKIEGLLKKRDFISKTEFLELENRVNTLEELLQKNYEETL